MKRTDHWIFYLKLRKELSDDFLLLDQHFKLHGKSLVPIGLKAFLDSIKHGQTANVLIVVKSIDEFKYFHRKIKKVLRFVMRSDRVRIYMLSSFSLVNDPSIMKGNQYSYFPLPVQLTQFSEEVCKDIDYNENVSLTWPGGVRPKLTLAS